MRLLVVLVCLFAVTVATNPGFRMRITDSFLQGVESLIRAVSEKQVKELPAKIAAGNLPPGVKITEMKIKSQEIEKTDIHFLPPNELRYTTTGGRVVVEAKMTANDQEATVTITVAGVNLDVGVAFGRSDDNHLTIGKTACALNVTTFNIEIDGFPDHPEIGQEASAKARQLMQMLPAMMCPQMEMVLGLATAQLGMLSHKMPFYEDMVVDMSLTSPPLATTDYIQFDLQGCTHQKDETEPEEPCEPQPIVDTADNSRMFYFWSTEAQNNNFFSEFHNHGKFTMTINKDSPAPLSEYYPKVKKHIKKLSDALGENYNGEDDVEVTMKTASAPSITIKTNPDKPKKALQLDVSMELTIKVNDKVITGVMSASGDLKVEVKPTPADQFYPDVKQTLEIHSLGVDSIEGVEVTDEQKAEVAKLMKSKIEKFFNAKIKEIGDDEKHILRKIAKIGKIDDFIYKLNDHTFEIGFNIHVDADELFKYAEKNSDNIVRMLR